MRNFFLFIMTMSLAALSVNAASITANQALAVAQRFTFENKAHFSLSNAGQDLQLAHVASSNGIDADYFTLHIQKCSAGIALVDGRIRLDQICIIVSSHSVRYSNRAVQGRYDAGRHGLAVTQRIADRNNLLTDPYVFGIGNIRDADLLSCLRRDILKFHGNNRKVIFLIFPLYNALNRLLIDKGNRQFG